MPHDAEVGEDEPLDRDAFNKMLVEAVLDSACISPMEQAARRDPKSWPVRYLPPGKLADLYLLYTAWARARGLEVAAGSTFRLAWKLDGWYKCLVFRKASTHSLCFTCGELKYLIQNANTVDDHIAACGGLHSHLRDQYKDREIYWQLRARSRTEKDVLCIIGDGMDQSKFGLPQWTHGRAPKHSVVEKNPRPSAHLYAVIAHGWRTDIYIGSEGVSSGSQFCVDMVLRTIDEVFRQSQRCGTPFPLDCIVQGDNTTKELKNSIIGRTLALLSLAGVFRAASHSHLRVGHTHEDVDQLFGLISRLSRSSSSTCRASNQKTLDVIDVGRWCLMGGPPSSCEATYQVSPRIGVVLAPLALMTNLIYGCQDYKIHGEQFADTAGYC